jgi:hypothetical protein
VNAGWNMPESDERWSEIEEPMTSEKGDLSYERSPSLRFFEDLVRTPDNNKLIPESDGSRELGPRSPSLFQNYPL